MKETTFNEEELKLIERIEDLNTTMEDLCKVALTVGINYKLLLKILDKDNIDISVYNAISKAVGNRSTFNLQVQEKLLERKDILLETLNKSELDDSVLTDILESVIRPISDEIFIKILERKDLSQGLLFKVANSFSKSIRNSITNPFRTPFGEKDNLSYADAKVLIKIVGLNATMPIGTDLEFSRRQYISSIVMKFSAFFTKDLAKKILEIHLNNPLWDTIINLNDDSDKMSIGYSTYFDLVLNILTNTKFQEVKFNLMMDKLNEFPSNINFYTKQILAVITNHPMVTTEVLRKISAYWEKFGPQFSSNKYDVDVIIHESRIVGNKITLLTNLSRQILKDKSKFFKDLTEAGVIYEQFDGQEIVDFIGPINPTIYDIQLVDVRSAVSNLKKASK